MSIVSSSIQNTSFSNIIRSKTKTLDMIDNYSAWSIFLRDHRRYLRRNSKLVRLAEIERIRSSYRLNTFLRNQDNSCKDVLPFLIANDYSSPADFNLTSTVVLVPSAKAVNELRKQYNTYRSVLKKAIPQDHSL